MNEEFIAWVSASAKCELNLKNEVIEGESHKIRERINNYPY